MLPVLCGMRMDFKFRMRTKTHQYFQGYLSLTKIALYYNQKYPYHRNPCLCF